MKSPPRPGRPSITPKLAVIPYEEGGSIEALLADFVERRRGHCRVAGLLQTSGREANGRPRMDLIDIASGQVIRISQNLGSDSKACCVDVTGVAEASLHLRHAIASLPDLLVINKFSGLEAKGGGLRAELLDALSQDLPVVIGLSLRHRAAFLAMTGGAGRFLDARIEALEEWWRGQAGAGSSLLVTT